MSDSYVVKDIDSLRGARAVGRTTRIVVALPAIGADRSKNLETRLNRLVSACGCQSSAAFFVAAAAACALADVLFWAELRDHLFIGGGINLAVCFAAIGLGRGLGLGVARWRLLHLIRGVEMQMAGSMH